MFSVIIPLFNKEVSVKETIQSALNQSFKEFEILIVNDGSTDNSLEVVEELKDSRIRIFNQTNGGVSSARNKGIEEAKYEWIVFLDADDFWEENHLEELRKMIVFFPDNKAFCTSHNKSKIKDIYEMKMIKGYEVVNDYFSVVMKHIDFYWTGAVCIHKTVFYTSGVFPLGISRGEDLYLWGEIGKRFQIIRSQLETVRYSYDSENKLTSKKSKYNDSIISIINFKNLKGSERVYYKSIIFKRLRNNLKTFSLGEIFLLLFKHNIQLLK